MSDTTFNHTIPPPPPRDLRPRRRPDQHSRQCPCKTLPQSLSSYTAAEYGDLHSLSRLLGRNSDIAQKFDAGGYTPLHLAAQNDHAAATSLLLSFGADVDGRLTDGDYVGNGPLSNRKGCGATPLHRASFSGAVSSMRILIDWNGKETLINSSSLPRDRQGRRHHSVCSRGANLLAKDESFGDCMTPLHKAAGGGRYLAVEVLLDALRLRDCDNDYSSGNVDLETLREEGASYFYVALTTLDAFGRTPLQVALEILPRSGEEGRNVQRWDLVAGCPPDWGRCVALLEAAEEEAKIQRQQQKKRKGEGLKVAGENVKGDSSLSSPSLSIERQQKSTLPPVPNHLSGLDSCLDCDADGTGQCKTSSWEAAFRSVLAASVNDKVEVRQKQRLREESDNYNKEKVNRNNSGMADQVLPEYNTVERGPNRSAIDKSVTVSSTMPQATEGTSPSTNKTVLGQKCGRCEKHCLALFRNNRGLLVCKKCRRK